jgi:hypothetical protein
VLFQPGPELVRAHITHAIRHVLQHPPVQGKAALDRVIQDLLQPSFPSSQKDISEYLEGRYLNRARRSFLNNLITGCLKALIPQANPKLVGKEPAILGCLIAVSHRHPEVYAERMAEELPRITDPADDAELRRVFSLFKADQRCWVWLRHPIRLRFIEMAKHLVYSPAEAETLLGALEIDELRPHLLSRIATLSATDRANVYATVQRPEFIEGAIVLLEESRSVRGAESTLRSVILPYCNIFRSEHIERFLKAAEEIPQIRYSLRVLALLEEMFERTRDLLPATRSAWQRYLTVLMQGKDPEEQSACSGLRTRMEQAGFWPVPPESQ